MCKIPTLEERNKDVCKNYLEFPHNTVPYPSFMPRLVFMTAAGCIFGPGHSEPISVCSVR